MGRTVLEKIRALLRAEKVHFVEKHHEPTFTSQESARARGEALTTGAKALLLKTDGDFCLFVLPADQRLNSNMVRRRLGLKKTRFASAEELLQLTGLVSGSVPPFGEPILPFRIFADTNVGRVSGKVAFNAGSLTDSIIMATDDWQRIVKAERFEFADAPGEGVPFP